MHCYDINARVMHYCDTNSTHHNHSGGCTRDAAVSSESAFLHKCHQQLAQHSVGGLHVITVFQNLLKPLLEYTACMRGSAVVLQTWKPKKGHTKRTTRLQLVYANAQSWHKQGIKGQHSATALVLSCSLLYSRHAYVCCAEERHYFSCGNTSAFQVHSEDG